MAKFIVDTRILDNNFKEISEVPKDKIYVEKTSRYQVMLGGKRGPEQVQKVVIHNEGKTLEFGWPMLKRLIENNITAESAFKEGMKNNVGMDSGKITFKSMVTIKYVGLVVGIIALIVTAIMFFALQADKNFTVEVIEFNSLSEIQEGDFVKTDAEYWDSYAIEIETTDTIYGIETGSSTSEGNTYMLMSLPFTEDFVFDYENPQEIDTFIFRYAAGSSYANQFESLGFEEYFLENLQGEVKSVSSVEDVDSGPTAIEFFEDSISTFNSKPELFGVTLRSPDLLIDGRVSQANFTNDVVIPTAVVGVIGVVGIALFVIFNNKHKGELDGLVKRMKGGSSSPVERK